ncbi:MAG: prolyl oligopeptidase family serine peptidase [Pseudomonadota bacterium]
MRRIQRFFSLALLLMAGSAAARGLTAEQLDALVGIDDPALSPDETRLVFSSVETDADADRRRVSLWQLRLDEPQSEPWRLTGGDSNDRAAQFSPDGQWIHFLSDRSGSAQVFRLHVAGGDAEPVTRLPLPVLGFRLAPDGAPLVVQLPPLKRCGTDFACSADGRQDAPALARVDRLPVDSAAANDLHSGLFAFALGDDGLPNGPAVDLTAALDADVPIRTERLDAVAVSPRSDALVFSAALADEDQAWTGNFDLYSVRLSGGRLRNLTADSPAADVAPTYLPNGDLVWLSGAAATADAPSPAASRRIRRRAGSSSSETIVADGWDRSPSKLIATRDPNRLYAIARDEGRQRLFEIDLATGVVEPRTAFGWVSDVVDSSRGPIAAMDSFHRPIELYRIGAEDSALYQLTSINATRLDDTTFGVYEQFRFSGPDGETLFGFLMRPPGHDGVRSVPGVVLLREAVHGSLADRFSARWHPQRFAAAGYAVLMIDHRGADGYGRAHMAALRSAAATGAVTDLRRGLAAAVERYPWLDSERLCAIGSGYGAYLVNWIAGHWQDGFRCLVSDSGIFDLRMAAYTTASMAGIEYLFDGPYHAATASYESQNPARAVADWTTPMLVLHDASYSPMPPAQSLATFGALQRLGIASELLVIEPADRADTTPTAQRQRRLAVSAWLERYLDR